MKELNLKQYLPHAAILLIFYLLAAVFFKDVTFKGMNLVQGDVVHYRGMARELMEHRNKGENILWTETAFGGMPTYQIHVDFPSNIVGYVDKLTTKLLPHPIYNVFLSMLGFYILMMVLGVNRYAAIFGSIAFAFSSYFFILLEAGHNSKAHAIAYFAPVLAGVIMTYRGKLLAGMSLSALFIALEIKSNHLQMAYYLFILVLVLAVCYFIEAVRDKKILDFVKASGGLALAALLAVGVNAGLLMTTLDYSKYTIRGKSDLTINPDGTKKPDDTGGLDAEYALAWSYGKGETMTLLIPNFKGGSSVPMQMEHKGAVEKYIDGADDPGEKQKREAAGNMGGYFGPVSFTSGPVYVGAIVVFLFVLGIFLTEGALKWAMIAGALLSIMLAWGRHFMGLTEFFLEYFPAYNKFRAVSSMLVVAELVTPILAALALDRLMKEPDVLRQKLTSVPVNAMKAFYISLAVTGGISLLVWLSPSSFTDLSKENEVEDMVAQYSRYYPDKKPEELMGYFTSIWPNVEELRENIVKSDAGRSFIFIILAGALIFFYSRKKIPGYAVGVGIALLTLVDMGAVNMRYFRETSFEKKKPMKEGEIENVFGPERPHAADLQIMQDTGHYRVFNQMARLDQDAATCFFHNSLSGYHGAKLKRYQDVIDFHLARGNRWVFNMLNTKYFIMQGQTGEPEAIANPEFLGPAWFVDEYKLVANPDSEILALREFQPAITAIIDQKYKASLPASITPDSMAGIRLVSYHPERLVYQTRSSQDGLAVFSEIYYPSGWNAYIDGKPVEYFCVNYILRGLMIPKGEHKVEWKFEPESYHLGENISMISSVLMLLMFGGVGFLAWRKRAANQS
ncbi:MAG: hypothetical protein IT233_05970 [Bacteroidia bacterium]|nr:hypothetical protein [Bacteroidia bacterium]